MLKQFSTILERRRKRWRIFACSADTVRRVKDPEAFASLCRDCAVPHPEISRARPQTPRVGSQSARAARGGVMLLRQRRAMRRTAIISAHVPGEPVSALFLAGGKRALILALVRNGHRLRRISRIDMAAQ